MRISRAFLLRWHRRVGLAAALFLLFIVITGFLLNHARLFGLDRVRFDAPWMLSAYGMEVPDDYLVGTVNVKGMVVAALGDGVALLTPDGELIERVPAASLPPGQARRIKALEDNVIFETTQGTYLCDADFRQCVETAMAILQLRPATPPPAVIQEAAAQLYHGGGVSLEKIMLDIHTGRVLGPAGAYFTDLIGLALLLLIISGVYNGMRQR